MSNKDKMQFATNIIVAAMQNADNIFLVDKLAAVPEALEDIFKKIDELDKNSLNSNETSTSDYNEEDFV